ncbi:LysR family transcriptional regulator [Acetobacter senegalensis]|uniref:LysR family transcriptional regulator n=1 Tax=Acetobacter senegalensis TaxID=446692 RepID=A0A0U5FNU5_9PROT|nr:LysR family transcriptional regulator [Acetobacter senegalensis]MCG4261924.1 LysR family transcriptional regulator [Acetobacter senegalensis]CEF41437.1 LysR family transcriptional regulator [Acetobacter senegalensis]
MDRSLLENVVQFLAVAETLSFTQAAKILRVTPTAISKSIRNLERRHGVVLFQRTTRHVTLTEAGVVLFQQLRHTVDDVNVAFHALSHFRDRPSGTLRLTFPHLIMTVLVKPLLVEFRKKYPDVILDLSLNEGTVDIVAANYDAGIRLGESIERDMVAVRLTPAIGWSVVGSPAYFARAGRPETPQELTGHEAILYRFVTSGLPHKWEFSHQGREFSVEVPSHLILNDRASVVSLARQGLGLAYVSDLEVREELANGMLESVLREFVTPDAGLFLYFPRRSQTQPKLRAFIDIAAEMTARLEFRERMTLPRLRDPSI